MFRKLINNCTYCKYAFYILVTFTIFINIFNFKHDNNLYILYIFAAILLGIGFHNKSNFVIAFWALGLVFCRFYLISESTSDLVELITYVITYLLITFITVELVRYAHKVKEEQVALTIVLSKALDARDKYTLHHSENTAKYAYEIAKKMNLPDELCRTIRLGSLLHDIGKIGIPENILKKSAELTADEYDTIKTHPTIGYEMIKHVSSLKEKGVLDIVLHHHERFDGKGYPKGLKGEEIPLSARIVTVADSFDAMTTRRSYRTEMDFEIALSELKNNKGTQFDPEVVDAFLEILEEEK